MLGSIELILVMRLQEIAPSVHSSVHAPLHLDIRCEY